MRLKCTVISRHGGPVTTSFERDPRFGVVNVVNGYVECSDECGVDLLSTGNFVVVDDVIATASATPEAEVRPKKKKAG
jgi:hypothetical protein